MCQHASSSHPLPRSHLFSSFTSPSISTSSFHHIIVLVSPSSGHSSTCNQHHRFLPHMLHSSLEPHFCSFLFHLSFPPSSQHHSPHHIIFHLVHAHRQGTFHIHSHPCVMGHTHRHSSHSHRLFGSPTFPISHPAHTAASTQFGHQTVQRSHRSISGYSFCGSGHRVHLPRDWHCRQSRGISIQSRHFRNSFRSQKPTYGDGLDSASCYRPSLAHLRLTFLNSFWQPSFPTFLVLARQGKGAFGRLFKQLFGARVHSKKFQLKLNSGPFVFKVIELLLSRHLVKLIHIVLNF